LSQHPARFTPRPADGASTQAGGETSMIFIGVVSVLNVFTLRQDLAGSDETAVVTAAQSLVAIKDWTFLLGPGIMAISGPASSPRSPSRLTVKGFRQLAEHRPGSGHHHAARRPCRRLNNSTARIQRPLRSVALGGPRVGRCR
jgi:hypothetical protein